MENNQMREKGLSEKNRNFIVILVAVVLLIFGPIEPYGIVIRFAYVIILPALLWLALRYWGSNWEMDSLSNDRLNSVLAGGIAGALLVGAYLSYTARYHVECDQYAGRGENTECVGDYKTVKGPDMVGALMKVFFAGIAILYAVSKGTEEK